MPFDGQIDSWSAWSYCNNINPLKFKYRKCPTDSEQQICKETGEQTVMFDCCDGFKMRDRKCEDVDECIDGTHNCNTSSECRNSYGSFDCLCLTGYSRQENVCADTDECHLGTHNCDANANCKNTSGS